MIGKFEFKTNNSSSCRLESKQSSKTRLLFCTTGILLRENQAIKLINQIKQTNWLIRDQWNNLSVDSALNKWENRNRINQSLCHLNNYFIHLLLISEKELREIQALFLNSITCFKEICKNELVILKSILFFICFILVCCYDANNNLNLAIKLWYSKSMLMIHLILMRVRMRIRILDPHWKIWIRI